MDNQVENTRNEECKDSVTNNDGNEGTNKLTTREIIAGIAIFILMVVGMFSIFYVPHLQHQIREQESVNLKLQERIVYSDAVKAFDEYMDSIDASKGMSMGETLDLEAKYLICYYVTNIERYSEEVDREQRLADKLFEAYENEKDAKNKEVIKECFEAHKLLLDNSQKELEKWTKLFNDYNEGLNQIKEELDEAEGQSEI